MKKRLTFTLVTLMMVAVGLMAFSQTSTASAQCIVKSYLPTYTVVRGDTLNRIARAHNTTIALLLDANCLSNANRINTGQVLYIPSTNWPGPGVNTEYKVKGAFQRFEGGTMLWRSDNGMIVVQTYNDGTFVYPSTRFGSLRENPVTDGAPVGFYKPILGFGKVWGNFADIRTQLGWATQPEFVYTILIFAYPDYDIYTLPDTTSLWVKREGSAIVPSPPPPTPVSDPLVVGVTYQKFESGFMVWLSHSNRIWVFRGDTGGTFQEFAPEAYGNLPDNPQTTIPPPGKFKPIYGFGKLWGNSQLVREDLGWATASEQAYRLSYLQQTLGFKATLPDGREVLVERGLWRLGTQPTAEETENP